MDIFVSSTIFLGIWGLISPFVGIRYGYELSARAQRRQWIAENKKLEYREVLTALRDDSRITLQFGLNGVIPLGQGFVVL
jgi:hypothetical protein